MPITASQLRADVYRLLDHVVETGEPLEIDRNGTILKIIAQPKTHWLDRLPRRDAIVGDPDDIVQVDWSDAWNPDPS